MKDALKKLIMEGKSLRLAGRYAEAVDVLRRALDLAESAYGRDAQEMIAPLHALGIAVDLHEDAGPSRLTEAPELLWRALRISEIHFGKDNLRQIPILNRLGLVLWGMERHEEALECLVKALAISEKAHGDHGRTGDILETLTHLLLEMNRPAEALPLAERALRIDERCTDDLAPVGVALASVALGQCYMGVGRNAEALTHLERGLALITARHPGKKSRIVDEIRDWIETLQKQS